MSYIIKQLLDDIVEKISNKEDKNILPNCSFTPQILQNIDQFRQLTNTLSIIQTQINILDATNVQIEKTKPLLQQMALCRPYVQTSKQSYFIQEGLVQLDQAMTVTDMINHKQIAPTKLFSSSPKFQKSLIQNDTMKIIITDPINKKTNNLNVPKQSWNNFIADELKIETKLTPFMIQNIFVQSQRELSTNLKKIKSNKVIYDQMKELASKYQLKWLSDSIGNIK